MAGSSHGENPLTDQPEHDNGSTGATADVSPSQVPADEQAAVPSKDYGGRPSAATLGFRAIELLAGTTLAIAQPLFSLLGDNPVFFVAHGVLGWELVSYALQLTFVIPTLLFLGLTALSFVLPRVGAVAHDVVVGLLISAAIAPPLARALGLGAALWLGLIVVVAVGVVALIRKAAPARSFLRVLSLSPVLFVGFFLFASPASDLLNSDSQHVVPTLSTPNTAPVVWLVLDQFPMSNVVDANGEIIKERYPNLARLQEISTWYPQATAGTVRTDRSVPAALTGRWPGWNDLPVASQHPANLFTLLGSEEYPVHAEEYVTQLCPREICGDTPQATDSTWADTRAVWVRYLLPSSTADRFVPAIDDRWDGFGDRADADPTADSFVEREARNQREIRELRKRADDNYVRFSRFLEPLQKPEITGVHYAHLFLPHEPMRYLPDGRIMNLTWEVSPDDEGRWPDSEPAMRTRLQRAMSQTMYADHLVGELLDTLEASGTLDEVALVVMSDHGASTRAGVLNRSDQDRDSAVDTVPLMLFMKEPGQVQGQIDDRRVQQVDILPTVLNMLEVPLTVTSVGTNIGSEHANEDNGNIENPDPNNVDFEGVIAWGDTYNNIWASRTPIRLTEDGRESFPNPPLPWQSPTVKWIADVFPNPGDPYRMQPFADLIGQRVDLGAVSETGELETTVSLDTPDAFVNVNLSGPDLPANISGVLENADEPLGVVAVINGQVGGASESFVINGEHRIGILIDPDTLISGENEVVILGVAMKEVPKTALNLWERIQITD